MLSDIFSAKTLSTGLDIGHNAVKCAVVDPAHGVIHGLWKAEIIEKRFAHDQTLAPETYERRMADLVQKCAKECPHFAPRVATAVQGEGTVSGYLELPALTQKELQVAVPSQAAKSIPWPMEEVTLSFVQVPPLNPNSAMTGVFFVAASKESVKRTTALLNSCGLEVEHIELPYLALAREMKENGDLPPREFACIIHIGHQLTQIVVMRDGFPYYARYFPIAGGHFTYGFQMAAQSSYDEAEKQKRNCDASQKETAIGPFLGRWIQEIGKSIAYFSARVHPHPGISRLVLSGGASDLKNLDRSLSAALNLPVEKYSWKKLKCAQSKHENPNGYKIAVGLALNN